VVKSSQVRNDNADDNETDKDTNQSPCEGVISNMIFDFLKELVHGEMLCDGGYLNVGGGLVE
jgi:hypothetical protein